MRTVHKAAMLIATTATIGATVLSGAQNASATTILGGVNMQAACNTQYPGFGLTAKPLDTHNAYSWRCTAPWDNTRGIDVNAACANQYGGGAYSHLLDPGNAYSWRCAR
jgi:hypothetical protein